MTTPYFQLHTSTSEKSKLQMEPGSLWRTEDHGFICLSGWLSDKALCGPKADHNCWSTFSTWRWTFVYCLGRGEDSATVSCQTPHHQSELTNMKPTRLSPPWVSQLPESNTRFFLQLGFRKRPEYECNCVITWSVCLVMQYLYTHSWAQSTERFYRQWAHLVPTLLKWISNGWYRAQAREKQDDPWTIYCATKWETAKNKIKWCRQVTKDKGAGLKPLLRLQTVWASNGIMTAEL